MQNVRIRLVDKKISHKLECSIRVASRLRQEYRLIPDAEHVTIVNMNNGYLFIDNCTYNLARDLHDMLKDIGYHYKVEMLIWKPLPLFER